MFHSNIARMKLILSKVPEYGCEQQLEAEIASANLLIARLEAQRQSSLKELNEVINKGDITEIKSLAAPPQVVKDVITSAMMLLGYPYKKAWVRILCVFLCGNGIIARVSFGTFIGLYGTQKEIHVTSQTNT